MDAARPGDPVERGIKAAHGALPSAANYFFRARRVIHARFAVSLRRAASFCARRVLHARFAASLRLAAASCARRVIHARFAASLRFRSFMFALLS